MTTLTDRYVREVARHTPAGQREDVIAELRATIADTVEARDTGEPEAAERGVLAEFGDPIRFAARYADRPIALIGPDLFPAYSRLLKVLLTLVLPVVVAAMVALEVADGVSISSVAGTVVGGVFVVGAQMFTWVTVVFALIERSDRQTRKVKEWTPDDLTEVIEPKSGYVTAVLSALWYALLIAVIVIDHVATPYTTHGGHQMEVLNPSLWRGWIWPILAGLVALLTLSLIQTSGKPITLRLAAWYAAAHALFALPLAWAFYKQQIIDQWVLVDINGPEYTTPDYFFTGIAVIILLNSAISVYQKFRTALR